MFDQIVKKCQNVKKKCRKFGTLWTSWFRITMVLNNDLFTVRKYMSIYKKLHNETIVY
jgi:enamine deaminase RidA (YjgF/YER057c/UK114 family)